MKGWAALVAALFAISLAAQERSASPAAIAFTDVSVIDISAPDARRAIANDQTVIISGDRITAVGERATVPRNTRTINGAGKFPMQVCGTCMFTLLRRFCRSSSRTASPQCAIWPARATANQEWRSAYQKSTPRVECGYGEIFTIVQ